MNGVRIFCCVLLTHDGFHREVYQDCQLKLLSSSVGLDNSIGRSIKSSHISSSTPTTLVQSPIHVLTELKAV